MMNIILMCGGDGSEHDISLKSADFLEAKLGEIQNVRVVRVVLHRRKWVLADGTPCIAVGLKTLVTPTESIHMDYVIPCIHGFPGETGDIQSFLEILGVPYMGCGSEASRLCFNKVSTKLWLSAVGIPNTPYVFLSDNSQASQASALQAMRNWGSVFVKAASQGSSVGCYKVDDLAKLPDAINDAFKYSRQVLVEKNVHPRELEVAVYQYGDEVIATNPGEIKTDKSTFYSWEEKYDGSSKAETVVEAELSDEQKEQIRSLALKAFDQLKLRDLSRIDFFISADGEILLNEINTFPGMTPISMFPKMLEHHGDSMTEFLKQCIAREAPAKQHR